MGKGRAVAIELNDVVRRELTALTRKHGAPQALAERARIVLAAAGGLKNKEIASKLGIRTHTVGTWRNRFAERGMDGLYDEPRPGAPREIGDDEIASTVRKTLETRPKGGTHWSLRSMAKEIGHAPSTVHRIWRAFGLQPHRVETFKLSSDPLFVEKVRAAARYRRPLSGAAGARARVVCRREEPGASTRPNPAASADATRTGRAA